MLGMRTETLTERADLVIRRLPLRHRTKSAMDEREADAFESPRPFVTRKHAAS